MAEGPKPELSQFLTYEEFPLIFVFCIKHYLPLSAFQVQGRNPIAPTSVPRVSSTLASSFRHVVQPSVAHTGTKVSVLLDEHDGRSQRHE